MICSTLNQHPSIVRHYLDHGLDPNAILSNGEPLQLLELTAFFLNPACAREMLSRGADPNLCGPRGIPPLARAIVSTHEPDTSLLELLIEHGAKLDSNLLFFAASPRVRQGELMTRFLLARGLDPNVTSTEWGTPLHCAIRAGKPNIVKLLLDAGANPMARSAGRKTNKQEYEVEEIREPDGLPPACATVSPAGEPTPFQNEGEKGS
ncbi:ankyrin repeat-containing domain protein [Aspergillus navahoensis]